MQRARFAFGGARRVVPASAPGRMPRVRAMASNFNPGQFIREVRHETSKVTWPGRRETAITTAMVLAFTVLAATFLFLVDQVLSMGVSYILGVGG